jgi:hypothetical protein
MDAPTFENLDLACAKVGKDIANSSSDDLEKIITDALAVLEEQGIYAMFLFLKTRAGSGGENVSQKLHKFLKETPQQAPLLSDNGDVFTSLQQLAGDLDRLLLARDLVRQTLVYARYHARLHEKSEGRT